MPSLFFQIFFLDVENQSSVYGIIFKVLICGPYLSNADYVKTILTVYKIIVQLLKVRIEVPDINMNKREVAIFLYMTKVSFSILF